jgi:gamma-glutamylcyclotransferase (GGCT)/AIG2-like uncharacterized protein YtfP
MPLLFSYGTLQLPKVQLATFGRLLDGQKDELVGFEKTYIPIGDPQVEAELGETRYANVVFNGRDDSRVAGAVFEITEEELASSDQYEEPALYKRIAVTLASGKDAWVYVSSVASR